MSALRHYTPKRDFSPAKAAPEAAAKAAPPMLTEEDANHLIKLAVTEARAQAFADGEAAGRKAAEASLAATTTAGVSSLRGRLDEFFAKEEETLREVEIRAVRLVLSVAQRIAVSMSEAEMESFSADVARRAIEAARGSSKIVFRMGDAVFKSLSDALSALAANGRVTIERDPALPPTGVQVEWDSGAVMFDPQALEKSVSDVLRKARRKLPDLGHSQDELKEMTT
jgi:flagellar assembly protein FliH